MYRLADMISTIKMTSIYNVATVAYTHSLF